LAEEEIERRSHAEQSMAALFLYARPRRMAFAAGQGIPRDRCGGKKMRLRTLGSLSLLCAFLILGLANCAVPPSGAPTSGAQPTPTVQPASTPTVAVPTRPSAVVAASDRTIVLVNGTLIDGTGADPLPDAAVVIQKGRIVGVGARAKVNLPADARIIDVQGATVLPGFFNAHIHSGYSASNLHAWAQAGVTTVRDLATSNSDPFSVRDALLKDNHNARLVAAGPMVTVPDGYPMVPWGMQGLTVTSPEDATQKVNRLLDQGADVIKIALDSGAIFGRKIPVLSAEQAAAIVRVAHTRGTRVSAHILASQDVPRVLDAGVDDIAHMPSNNLSDELIEKVVKAGIYWVPTIELWKRVGQGDQVAMANLGRFVRAGGKVALGTDYDGYAARFELGMPMLEIEAMQAVGMPPMQIIVAGTQNAAHACNLERELGTLEAGKIADVLVVDGDPLQDLHALTHVRMVIHNGEVIRGEE